LLLMSTGIFSTNLSSAVKIKTISIQSMLDVQWVTTTQVCLRGFFTVKATADWGLVCATHNVPAT
jgi:hypothetical protein